MMFNTGSNTNGAPDGAPSSCPHDTNGDGNCGKRLCPHCGEDARRELARYKAGLNYRRGYLDALNLWASFDINPAQYEQAADEAVKKFLEAFR